MVSLPIAFPSMRVGRGGEWKRPEKHQDFRQTVLGLPLSLTGVMEETGDSRNVFYLT